MPEVAGNEDQFIFPSGSVYWLPLEISSVQFNLPCSIVFYYIYTYFCDVAFYCIYLWYSFWDALYMCARRRTVLCRTHGGCNLLWTGEHSILTANNYLDPLLDCQREGWV